MSEIHAYRTDDVPALSSGSRSATVTLGARAISVEITDTAHLSAVRADWTSLLARADAPNVFMPQGDEKSVASEYAVSFGGNAVTAAFCCAKLGIKPDLIATSADDWLGNMFLDMAAKYAVRLHPRKVEKSSLSFIMPKDGQRAIVRCRDDHYLSSFPVLDLDGCQALHLDGHQPDAAMFYAQRCRKAGILTSLDGGGLRTNTHELLTHIDVAIVAERFCQQMDKTPAGMLDYLKARGCKIGGVTRGERGMLWYEIGRAHV